MTWRTTFYTFFFLFWQRHMNQFGQFANLSVLAADIKSTRKRNNGTFFFFFFYVSNSVPWVIKWCEQAVVKDVDLNIRLSPNTHKSAQLFHYSKPTSIITLRIWVAIKLLLLVDLDEMLINEVNDLMFFFEYLFEYCNVFVVYNIRDANR